MLSTGEFDLLQTDFEYHDKVNNSFPRQLELKHDNKLKTKLKVQKIIDSDNLLQVLNPVIRFVANKILKRNPSYFRFNSRFEIDIDIFKSKGSEKGETLHEMVILK